MGTYYEHLETINGVRLTHREVDVIACLLSGRSTKSVALLLSIDQKTVETHKYNIMRKLECNSKESIISFVERCGKNRLVRAHYQGLMIESEFGNCLKKISSLIVSVSPSCTVVYWKEEGRIPSFINALQTYLRLSGIRERVEAWTGTNTYSTSDPLGYILYVPPVSVIKTFQVEDTGESPSIFAPFIQEHPQNLDRIILLLWERDVPVILPQAIQDIKYIDFARQSDYYYPFFELLEKIVPSVSLKSVIDEFREQYEASQDTFITISPGPQGDSGKGKEYVPAWKSIFLWILKTPRKNLLSSGAAFLLILCFVILLLREDRTGSISQSLNNHSAAHARSELSIPHDDILLKREHLLSELDAHFKRGTQDIKTVALVGIGGSGKTIIARQYARLQKGLVWEANAETKRSLRESFENFAYLLAVTEEEKKTVMGVKDIKDPEEKEEKVILFVKSRLRLNPEWFLIFDNVEKFPDIIKYFPSDTGVWGKGKVLITTQNSNLETHSSVQHTVLMKELIPEEKLTLFIRIMGNEETQKFTPHEKEKALVFLNTLPSFPLDVCVAAYYLKATGISYGEYLKNISEYKKGFDSVQNNILTEMGVYAHTRYKIITLSLEKILKESKNFGDLLLFISLISPHNIPKDPLNGFKDPIVVDDFIHHLKKYSLATQNLSSTDASISFAVHRSTQDIALAYLTKDLKIDNGNTLIKDISYALDNYMDKALEEEDFPKMQIMAGHIEKFLNHRALLTDLSQGLLVSKLGCLYYFLNNDKSAQTIKDSLKIFTNLKALPPEGNLRVTRSLLHIGAIYAELKFHEEARQLLEKVAAIYGKGELRNDTELSWALSHLGNVYRRMGNYEMAKSHLEESIRLNKRYGTNNRRIARTLSYLGSVYRGLGFYQKSLEVLKEGLALYRKYYSGDHYRVGWILTQLGYVYQKLGDYQKAKEYLENGLLIFKKYFPEDHTSIGLALAYLGNCLRELGDYEKSCVYLEQSLKIHQKQFDESHLRMGWILFHLASTYKYLGKYKEYQELFNKVLNLKMKILEINNSDYAVKNIRVVSLLRYLAEIYLEKNQLEDAENLIKRSLNILQYYNHLETYLSLEVLGEIYVKKSIQSFRSKNTQEGQNFKNQAIDQFNQALKIIERHFSKNSAHIKRLHSRIKEVQEKIA